MIREYFGNLGTGKTFNMSYDIMWWLKHGLRVVTNYEVAFCTKHKELNNTDHTLKDNCKFKGDHCWSNFYPDPEEYLYHVIKDEHTLFAVDEASIIFPPRVKLPRSFLHKFLQSRKDSCNLYYTAQVPKYVYPMLRYLTNQTVRCSTQKAFGMFSKVPILTRDVKDGKLKFKGVDSMYFKARWYDTNITERKMNFYDRKGRDRAWRTRVLSPAVARIVFRSYNTLYKVNYSEGFKIKKPTISEQTTVSHKPYLEQAALKPNLALIEEAQRSLEEAQTELAKDGLSHDKRLFRRSAFYNQN